MVVFGIEEEEEGVVVVEMRQIQIRIRVDTSLVWESNSRTDSRHFVVEEEEDEVVPAVHQRDIRSWEVVVRKTVVVAGVFAAVAAAVPASTLVGVSVAVDRVDDVVNTDYYWDGTIAVVDRHRTIVSDRDGVVAVHANPCDCASSSTTTTILQRRMVRQSFPCRLGKCSSMNVRILQFSHQ
jgi:hypothetical protein